MTKDEIDSEVSKAYEWAVKSLKQKEPAIAYEYGVRAGLNLKIDALQAEVAQLRATNARMTAALEKRKHSQDCECYGCEGLTDALSLDASQDLACVREAMRLLDEGWVNNSPTHEKALDALCSRFGDAP